eukprot:scaffold41387_cov176-Amphora_coffeaeformis.AAC.1
MKESIFFSELLPYATAALLSRTISGITWNQIPPNCFMASEMTLVSSSELALSQLSLGFILVQFITLEEYPNFVPGWLAKGPIRRAAQTKYTFLVVYIYIYLLYQTLCGIQIESPMAIRAA